MPIQTGSINLKAAKAAADIAKETSQYFWFNSQDSGAGEGAGAHITEVDSDTFISNPSNGGGNVLINNNSVNIRDGVTNLATFGSSGAQIGKTTSAHSVLDVRGQRIYADDGTTLLANIGYDPATGVGNGKRYYTLGKRKTTSDAYDSTQTYSVGDMCVHIGGDGQPHIYVCMYEITTPEAWNSAHWELYIANDSFAEGEEVISCGYASHAEGYETRAMSTSSHAEGFGATARGNTSHAEGYKCVAKERNSHAEGSETVASGYISHASGEKTEASRRDQFVIGKYNVVDTQGQYYGDFGDYAFIIGNGTADNARSNALTVDWNGNVNIPTGTAYKVGGVSLVDLIYPVGSIYMSVNSTSPATLFGGTWQQIEDTFLLAAGNTYTAGDTGGEATHKLIESELPKISGYISHRGVGTSSNFVTSSSGHFSHEQLTGTATSAGPGTANVKAYRFTYEFGGNGAHENMPPYLAVYVWQRTA